ncbi:MAG: Na/Pi symporter [Endomicrobium sp.]|nr:Na/Pi symporter [Endomicrobium sp.]
MYAILLEKKWYVEAFVDIFGGLSLLLFGMSFVNDSLQKFAGQKLKNVLTSLTSSKFKSLFSGFTFTIANQSSSATMLLIISLISTGIISFYQSMSISLGASLGSTITAQLMAFKFADLAMFIIVLGYILSFTFKEKRISKIGDAVFGFGLLFLGMKFISNSISSITVNSDIFNLISNINSPIIGIFAGIIITLILQSSGAVVGIVITLAGGDVISLLQAVELALGSQIGTCITVVLWC